MTLEVHACAPFERCAYHGHAWSEPSLWEAEPLGPLLLGAIFNPPPPGQAKVRKQRVRGCRRCHVVEWEDGDGRRQLEPFW